MSGHRIQLASASHLDELAGIERAAAVLFSPTDVPLHLRTKTVPAATLAAAQAAGRLWVALAGEGHVVGFSLAEALEGFALLAELDVHPDHGRRGLGAGLVAAVVAWAKESKLSGVGLTTFSHLPWNAPFYERLGFRRLAEAELPRPLAAALAAEAAAGYRNRVALWLPLPPPT